MTNRKIKAVRTTNYEGNAGELWFVRVLPPPFDTLHMDHYVIFNTPYVLIRNYKFDTIELSVEKQWLACFDRLLPTLDIDDHLEAYDHFMRYGLALNFWLEYVFLSYINFVDGAILLGGYPDIRRS